VRILVARDGPYPAREHSASSLGLSGYRVSDLLVKGLTELGHDVSHRYGDYRSTARDADITYRLCPAEVRHSEFPRPWVRPCHSDGAQGWDEDHWIFVSQTLARAFGRTRWVMNGIDPAEFVYCDTKEDYFLFVACLDRFFEKGLDIAVALARTAGFRLVVAGSATDDGILRTIRDLCAGANVTFAGEIAGTWRADVFAGARALLFPTRVNEACGLVIAEALMSGTPVIASDRGACPELVSPEAGFVCASEEEYRRAIANVDRIAPSACRARAMREFHYLRMTRDYLREFEAELG
jgi:glycosyltransferase involved in cell wall biosynthesis